MQELLVSALAKPNVAQLCIVVIAVAEELALPLAKLGLPGGQLRLFLRYLLLLALARRQQAADSCLFEHREAERGQLLEKAIRVLELRRIEVLRPSIVPRRGNVVGLKEGTLYLRLLLERRQHRQSPFEVARAMLQVFGEPRRFLSLRWRRDIERGKRLHQHLRRLLYCRLAHAVEQADELGPQTEDAALLDFSQKLVAAQLALGVRQVVLVAQERIVQQGLLGQDESCLLLVRDLHAPL